MRRNERTQSKPASSVSAFEQHIKSLSQQFSVSLFYLMRTTFWKEVQKFGIVAKHTVILTRWRRLFRSSDISARSKLSDEEIDRAVLDVSFQFFIAKMVDWITGWKGKENARYFLTFCDLWLVHPLSRYVEIYGSGAEGIRKPNSSYRRSALNIMVEEECDAMTASFAKESTDAEDELLVEEEKEEFTDAKDGRETTVPLDLEDSYLPDHILKFRELIYSKLNELLIQCMQYLIQEYHFVFTPEETKKMVKEFNFLIETRYTTLKGNKLFVPLHLSSEGINGFIKEFMEAICQILAPACWKALKFTFRADVPKFFKGFLIRLNDMVVIYNQYLQRRYTAETFDVDRDIWIEELVGQTSEKMLEEQILDLFLFSELQKGQEIHSAIALTMFPLEIKKETEYFAALLRSMKRNFFPGGFILQIFSELFPELKGDDDEALNNLAKAEPYMEAVFLNKQATVIREQIHHYTSALYINKLIIDLIRDLRKDLFDSEVAKFISKYEEELSPASLSNSSTNLGSNSDREASFSAAAGEENGGSAASNRIINEILSSPISQRNLAENLLRRLASEIFSEHCKKSIWRTLLGYEKLAVGAVMQLFELAQKQVFVKNLLFQTIDFVMQEIECNSFYNMHQTLVYQNVQESSGSRVMKWMKSMLNNRSPFEWQRGIFDDKGNGSNGNSNVFVDRGRQRTNPDETMDDLRLFDNRNATSVTTANTSGNGLSSSIVGAGGADFVDENQMYDYVQEEVKSTQKNFRSLFEYLQGSFATSLAKNLVDLVSFQKYQISSSASNQGKGLAGTSILQPTSSSSTGRLSRSSSSERGAPPPSITISNENTDSSISWSAAIGTRLLNVSTNLYGLNDIVGEFLVTSIQETLGPLSLLHIGSVEEVILRLAESALELVKEETENCRKVRLAFEKVVQSPTSGPLFIANFDYFINASGKGGKIRNGAQGLEQLLDCIKDLEMRAIFATLVAQVVASHGTLQGNEEAEKLWKRIVYCMERYQLKAKVIEKLSWSVQQ